MTSIKNTAVTTFRAAILAIVGIAMPAQASAGDFEPVRLDITENITGIEFVSADTGFVVSQGGQLGITHDGGRTWRVMTIAPNAPLEDVSFLDGRTGAVCGRGGSLYVTTDGGRRWENRSIMDTVSWLLSVQWVDSLHAVAAGMTRATASPLLGFTLVTRDRGRTWQRQESMGLGYGELFRAPHGPVYFQSFGKLHMSRDGGQTWRTIETLDGIPGRVTSVTGRVGILAGAGGRIMYSHDNGRTWNDASADPKNVFTSLAMVNADTGYVAGLNGVVMKTTDAGVSWTDIALDPSLAFDIYDMAIAGEYVYLVGRSGTVLRARRP
ncbi:MAG: YCF48-related protein [candidate division Zixibacteria bacterium]|jgi:photosystem II stability/assembly factor-like uncharacterized protein|nr:YCF48-related protein [candidate division Zixibacteria bacterium]